MSCNAYSHRAPPTPTVNNTMAAGALTVDQLASRSEPFVQFRVWYEDAVKELKRPGMMCLSTCGKSGKPSSRNVQMLDFDQNGLVFITDGKSRKVTDLSENPNVSAVFTWMAGPMQRQVRVVGKVEPLSRDTVTTLIKKFPRPCQLVMLSIVQDTVLADRAELDHKYQETKDKYAETESADLPVPDQYVGYRIVPDQFEFMRVDHDWLTDRFEFTLQEDGKWTLQRLAP